MTPRQKLGVARVRTFEFVPYLASHIYRLKERETPGIGTAAVDAHGNLYWDAEYITQTSVDETAYIVAHEAVHLIYEHHNRAAEIFGGKMSEQERFIANVAADLVIEQTLSSMRHIRPKGAIYLGCKVPKLNGITLDFPENRSMQEYIRLIIEKLKSQQNESESDAGHDGESDSGSDDELGDSEAPPVTGEDPEDGFSESEGQGDDGPEGGDDESGDQGDARYEAPPVTGGESSEGEASKGESHASDEEQAAGSPGMGGSCADGKPRPYEIEDDGSWEGFGKHEAAEAIEQYEKDHPGSVPGNLLVAVSATLRPQPDPFSLLRSAVCASVASSVGGRDFSHRRRSRKQQPGEDQPILHGRITVQPRAAVIVDTSGSMMSPDTYAKVLSVVAQGVRKLGTVKVYCADTSIRSHSMVRSCKQFVWQGGGGTDMSRALLEVDERDHPDSIVLVTDAETYWLPDHPKARVVVAYIGKDGSSWHQAIPKNFRTVVIPKMESET
jgi:predicted metal-dependent peptidase